MTKCQLYSAPGNIYYITDIGSVYVSVVRFVEPKLQVGPYIINLPKGYARFHHPFKRQFDSGIHIMDNKWNGISLLYIDGCSENRIEANIIYNYKIIKEDIKNINNVNIKSFTIKENQNQNNSIIVVFEGYCICMTVAYSEISDQELNRIILSIINDITTKQK